MPKVELYHDNFQMKIARIATGVQKEDSYVDAAGYIACAYEVCAASG